MLRWLITELRESQSCISTRKEVWNIPSHAIHLTYLFIDGQSKALAGQFELFAKENKGMFRMGAVDCEEHTGLCSKEAISKYPTWKIYPPFPVPAFEFTEEPFDFDKLKKSAAKFITSRSIEITQNNYETFVNDNPGKPKVLLFTDKKGTPLIYKALSSHFDVSPFLGLNTYIENFDLWSD